MKKRSARFSASPRNLTAGLSPANGARYFLGSSLKYCLALILVGALLSSPLAVHTKAHPNPSRLLEARFEVTMNGFHVTHETKDDALGRDGKFDEIRLMTNTYVINSSGAVGAQHSFKSAVICDGTFRDPDGIAIASPMDGQRGFKAGDDFPTRTPWAASPGELGINVADLPPLTLFEGRLTQGSDAVVIIPTIWEMDGAQELRTSYNDQLSFLSSSLGRSVADIIRAPRPGDPFAALRDGATVGLATVADRVFIGKGFLGLGDPKDRPIGLVKRGDRYVFVPKVLVLTFDAAEALARTNGVGPGVIKVSYDDDGDQQGQYTLFLQVKRVGN